MNRYLMMSAAALLGSTAAANAATYTFQFGTSGGGTYCDGGKVRTGAVIWVWRHTNNNCAGGVSNGIGFLTKTKGFGKGAQMSDNYFGSAKSIALSYWLPKRMKDGSKWALWIEFSGVSSFLGNSGPLVNVVRGGNNAASGRAGTKSTLAKVKTLIQSHRNPRQKT